MLWVWPIWSHTQILPKQRKFYRWWKWCNGKLAGKRRQIEFAGRNSVERPATIGPTTSQPKIGEVSTEEQSVMYETRGSLETVEANIPPRCSRVAMDCTIKKDRCSRQIQEHAKDEEEEDIEMPCHRLREPEVIIAKGGEETSENEEESEMMQDTRDNNDDEEMDEDVLERRRLMMEQAKQGEADKDLLEREEEVKLDVEQEKESSEHEYADSQEETRPRLKPVFVRGSDHVTVQEDQKMELDEEQQQETKKKRVKERKKVSRKLAEDRRQELQRKQGAEKAEDEEEYMSWKFRELRRIKKDRDEHEQIKKECKAAKTARTFRTLLLAVMLIINCGLCLKPDIFLTLKCTLSCKDASVSSRGGGKVGSKSADSFCEQVVWLSNHDMYGLVQSWKQINRLFW